MSSNGNFTNVENFGAAVSGRIGEHKELAGTAGDQSLVQEKLRGSAQLDAPADSLLAKQNSSAARKDVATVNATFGKVTLQEPFVTKVDADGRPTEYNFGSGNTREVSYLPNGKIKEIDIRTPGGDKHGLIEKIVIADGGKEYQCYVNDANGKMTEVRGFKDATISKDGTIHCQPFQDGQVYYLNGSGGGHYEYAITPNGNQHVVCNSDGVTRDLILHPDGSVRDVYRFPHSTVRIDYNDAGRVKWLGLVDNSGGTITYTLRKDGDYDCVSRDPQGHSSKDVLEAGPQVQQAALEQLNSAKDLRINWHPADRNGVHYDTQLGPTLWEELEQYLESFFKGSAK